MTQRSLHNRRSAKPQRQRTGALQNWRTVEIERATRERRGVRQSSAALSATGVAHYERKKKAAGKAGCLSVTTTE